MERLRQDLKFAVRLLWKDRGFAATAALTLALCIGANAAIFAIVNAVLLQPLAVPEPDRLVLLYNSYPNAGAGRGSTSVPDYFDRLRETDVFEEQTLYNPTGVTLGATGDPRRIRAMIATPTMLRLLRTHAVRGRLFTEDDGQTEKNRHHRPRHYRARRVRHSRAPRLTDRSGRRAQRDVTTGDDG